MSFSTVGDGATPGHNWFEQGVNTPPNIVASGYTMPSPGGTIYKLWAYFGLVAGGPATAYLCMWDASGSLLGSVGVSVANGSASAGGQAWNGANLATPVFVASGATVYFGFAVSESNGFYTTDESSGSSIWTTNSSVPNSLNGNSSTGHFAIGAYAEYFPGVIHVWNGSSWLNGEVQVWNGSAWANPTGILVWNGSAWVNAT